MRVPIAPNTSLYLYAAFAANVTIFQIIPHKLNMIHLWKIGLEV
jgi:hypothetical protein